VPLRRAEITGHAWQQFVIRWGSPRPACYLQALHEIMAQAREEDLGYHAVLRTLNNRMTPARYFITMDWRFVTNEEITVILTIEKPDYRGTIINRQKKRRRQKS
jgi:hypothetical protein